jgi:hypothetical protein
LDEGLLTLDLGGAEGAGFFWLWLPGSSEAALRSPAEFCRL